MGRGVPINPRQLEQKNLLKSPILGGKFGFVGGPLFLSFDAGTLQHGESILQLEQEPVQEEMEDDTPIPLEELDDYPDENQEMTVEPQLVWEKQVWIYILTYS